MSAFPSMLRERAAARTLEAPARIGPNAVLQSWRALAELEDEPLVQRVRRRACLPEPLPDSMIPEAWFIRLVDALRREMDPDRSDQVLRLAGRYTAGYVAAHRIPGFARGLLAVLPERAAIPLLLAAFRTHAWTFAGGGRFVAEHGYPGTIRLEGAPTCRDRRADRMCGSYYAAAFEGLLRLASPGLEVREVACEATGDPCCRFRLSLPAPPSEVPCESS